MNNPLGFYLIEVTIESIAEQDERERFMNILTSLALHAATVDDLHRLTDRLLAGSPDLPALA